MITYEFNFVCDAPRIIGKRADDCDGMESQEVWKQPSDINKAWRQVRALGWREAKWKGKTRHLCPSCWEKFLERRK